MTVSYDEEVFFRVNTARDCLYNLRANIRNYLQINGFLYRKLIRHNIIPKYPSAVHKEFNYLMTKHSESQFRKIFAVHLPCINFN